MEKQGKSKLLQPLLLKAPPKTIALSAVKARDLSSQEDPAENFKTAKKSKKR
jgi:hypothetical protein